MPILSEGQILRHAFDACGSGLPVKVWRFGSRSVYSVTARTGWPVTCAHGDEVLSVAAKKQSTCWRAGFSRKISKGGG